MSSALLERLRWSRATSIPVIRQRDAAEAGIACIAMVASFHGVKADINRLRIEQAIAVQTTGTQSLVQIADRLGMTARVLQLEVEHVARLQMPAILSCTHGHYVVLTRIRRNVATIHDPASGARELSLQSLAMLFQGTAIELLKSPTLVRAGPTQKLSFGHLWTELVGLKRYLVQLMMLSALLQTVSLLSPFYVQLVIDDSLARTDRTFLDLLALCFIVVAGLQALLTWLRSWALLYLGSILSIQMQNAVVRHLIGLPLTFFTRRHVGDIISRYGATAGIQSFLTNGLITVVADIFMLSSTLVAVLLYSPKLAGITLVLLVIYAGSRVARFRTQKRLSTECLVTQAESSSHLMETVRNMATIKVFGIESQRLDAWLNRSVEQTNAGIRLARLNLGYTAFNKLIFNLGNVVVVYCGATLILDGTFSTGMLVAFLAYQNHLLNAGADLIDQLNAYKMLSVNLERLSDIVLTPPEERKDLDAGLVLEPQRASLEVRNASFRYSALDPYVLDDVSLTVSPGECVVITGASGAGKSTLIRIMLGLEQLDEGVVLFAGTDIRRLGLQRYRGFLAAVTQEDRLFSGTVAENIAMFCVEPDWDRLRECARHACIHDAIAAMPLGYQTRIGEMGDTLSAGQRQRVMLARALYKQPRVLLLDEVTSNLDRELDDKVNLALANLRIGRVIVTHRQTSLAYADKVYALRGAKLECISKLPSQPSVHEAVAVAHASL